MDFGGGQMQAYARCIVGALIAVAGAGLAPVPVLAQAPAAQGEGVPAQVQDAISALKVAIQEGNVDKVAQTLTGTVIQFPAVARLLAQAMGEAAANNPTLLNAVVERASGSLSTGIKGDNALHVLANFTSGVTSGVLATVGNDANKAKELVQNVAASALSGAAKNESELGQMARVVAAGMTQGMTTGSAAISPDMVLNIVRTGIGMGAVKVAGPGVTVDVVGKGKQTDIIISKDGKEFDRGKTIDIDGPQPKPDGGEKEKASAS